MAPFSIQREGIDDDINFFNVRMTFCWRGMCSKLDKSTWD